MIIFPSPYIKITAEMILFSSLYSQVSYCDAVAFCSAKFHLHICVQLNTTLTLQLSLIVLVLQLFLLKIFHLTLSVFHLKFSSHVYSAYFISKTHLCIFP